MLLKSLIKLSLATLSVALFIGCRGSVSSKPPIHLNPNMDLQDKYKAQEESHFFADGRAMRPIEEGVIPFGRNYETAPNPDFLKADKAFYEGVDASGKPVTDLPELSKLGFASEKELLKRGKERYDIYCSVCHGTLGNADSIVHSKGFTSIISLVDPKSPKSAGQIYQAILLGSKSQLMRSYAYQVDVKDRWAVAAYVQFLAKTAQTDAFVKAVENNKEKK